MFSIRAKVKGQATNNISACRISTWLVLLNCYADKGDCFTLGIEISKQKQDLNESPFNYYSRIQKLLNLQITYFTTNVNASESRILSEYARKNTLRVFLTELKEHLGSLMRTKNSRDLCKTLSMMTNDFQIDALTY